MGLYKRGYTTTTGYGSQDGNAKLGCHFGYFIHSLIFYSTHII